MRLKIYIAGPISKGDRDLNFSQAAEAQERLMALGFAPLNPMLSMKHPNAFDIPWKLWMACDYPWVLCADAILRLPGESQGADVEVALASQHGIPVFTSIETLCDWVPEGTGETV